MPKYLNFKVNKTLAAIHAPSEDRASSEHRSPFGNAVVKSPLLRPFRRGASEWHGRRQAANGQSEVKEGSAVYAFQAPVASSPRISRYALSI